MESWSTQQVCLWLKTQNDGELSHLCQIFMNESISGDLLKILTIEHLKTDMGIRTLRDQLKFKKARDQLIKNKWQQNNDYNNANNNNNNNNNNHNFNDFDFNDNNNDGNIQTITKENLAKHRKIHTQSYGS